MATWTVEDRLDQILAAEVQKYVILYNTKLKEYRNNQLKWTAWNMVAAALGRKVEDCESRWKTIRDKYVRYKRTVKTRPTDIDYIPADRWPVYRCLSFLDEVITHRRTRRSRQDYDANQSDALYMMEGSTEENSGEGMEEEMMIPIQNNYAEGMEEDVKPQILIQEDSAEGVREDVRQQSAAEKNSAEDMEGDVSPQIANQPSCSGLLTMAPPQPPPVPSFATTRLPEDNRRQHPKKRSRDMDREIDEELLKALRATTDSIVSATARNSTLTQCFGAYVTCVLDRLPARLQCTTRHKIAVILHDAEREICGDYSKTTSLPAEKEEGEDDEDPLCLDDDQNNAEYSRHEVSKEEEDEESIAIKTADLEHADDPLGHTPAENREEYQPNAPTGDFDS